MNIISKESAGMAHELKIEIVKEDYFETVEKLLKKERKTAAIPGFRPGNAPMGMIRHLYYKPILANELDKIISKAMYGYFEENKIDTIFEPIPLNEKSNTNLDEENFTFSFEYATRPDFELPFKEMPAVPRFKVSASQKDIDENIENLRAQHGEYSNPEIVETEKDQISVSYGEDKTGYINMARLTPEGAALLTGKKVGDEFEISLRALYSDTLALAHFLHVEEKALEDTNEYRYLIKIQSIGRIIPAEMNETFFETAFKGKDIKDETAARTFVENQIASRWQTEADRIFLDDAVKMLTDNAKIDLSDDFIKRYLIMSRKDITDQNIEEQYPFIKRSIIWQLIENKIFEDNNLQVTEEDVVEEASFFFMERYFAHLDEDFAKKHLHDAVENALKEDKQKQRFAEMVKDKKILSFLLQNLNIEEHEGNSDEMVQFFTDRYNQEKEKKEITQNPE
ncbi:MAG: hypothetical protein LBR51_00130 [Bacteroidales bacterium]|jgi:trigger factor|nr:hypothetical protein [Bacteroidales bacterium]